MASPPMDVYTMEEFLEVLSIQEQTVFLEIKRKQREAAAAGGSGGACSLEDMLEMMALQQKKATFEKKRRERLACPNTRRQTVIELFGELHYSEPLPPSPPPPVDRAHLTSSPPAATFSVGEGSGSLPGEVREADDEEGRDPNHASPRQDGGRNVGEGKRRA